MYPRYTKDEKESLKEMNKGIADARYSIAHQNSNDACRLTNAKICQRIIHDLTYSKWKLKKEHKEKVKKWWQAKIGSFSYWMKTLVSNIFTIFYNVYISVLVKFYR